MREKILENWLDSATELSFQVPFCAMLQAEGYTLIHLTRHNAMEMGKDVIAIAPDGVPCAFQLKSSTGKRITLSKWRTDIEPQMSTLMQGKIVHPSVPNSPPHRTYLVTNRDLDEEVSRTIDDLNRLWQDRGLPEIRLETIVRGQLLRWAMVHSEVVWPSELTEVQLLLGLFLADGAGPLDKEKVAQLLEHTMLGDTTAERSKAEVLRLGTSSALLCALALSAWSRTLNHVAEVEGWVVYLAALMAASEQKGLVLGDIQDSYELAEATIRLLLGQLCEELQTRKHLVEGNPLVDRPFFGVRVTQLVGLMSLYGLWLRRFGEDDTEHFRFSRAFCQERGTQIVLWGEAAVPQFLAHFWFLKEISGSSESDFLLMAVLETLANRIGQKGHSIADPYRDFPSLMSDEAQEEMEDSEPSEVSWMAKGILHLVAKRNWKEYLRGVWPGLTRLSFAAFYPAELWQFYLWRSEQGTNVIEFPPYTKVWSDLSRESLALDESTIPVIIRQYPLLMLLFIMTYPHRATPETVKWLDREFRSV